MAIRDKITTNVQPHLQPGETVQGVLTGQTHSQFIILIGILPFVLLNRYRTIVATDRRILVLDSGKWTTTKARSIVAELPRAFPLGPWTATVWQAKQLGPDTLRIHRRFKPDIEAIDAAGAGSTPPPPPAS